MTSQSASISASGSADSGGVLIDFDPLATSPQPQPTINVNFENVFTIAYLCPVFTLSTFLPLDAMLGRFMVWRCDHPSVHLFVCLSQSGIVQEWLNVGSCKQRHSPGALVF